MLAIYITKQRKISNLNTENGILVLFAMNYHFMILDLHAKRGEMETLIEKSKLPLRLQKGLSVFIIHVRGRVTMMVALACFPEYATSERA